MLLYPQENDGKQIGLMLIGNNKRCLLVVWSKTKEEETPVTMDVARKQHNKRKKSECV